MKNKIALIWTIPDKNQLKIWTSTFESLINSLNLSNEEIRTNYEFVFISDDKGKLNILNFISSSEFEIIKNTRIVSIEDILTNNNLSTIDIDLLLSHGQFWWLLSLFDFQEYKEAIFLDSDIWWNSNFTNMIDVLRVKNIENKFLINGRTLPLKYSYGSLNYLKKYSPYDELDYLDFTTINGGIIYCRLDLINKFISKQKLNFRYKGTSS